MMQDANINVRRAADMAAAIGEKVDQQKGFLFSMALLYGQATMGSFELTRALRREFMVDVSPSTRDRYLHRLSAAGFIHVEAMPGGAPVITVLK